jgi:glycerophosphoryl diester phosphodiesterase
MPTLPRQGFPDGSAADGNCGGGSIRRHRLWQAGAMTNPSGFTAAARPAVYAHRGASAKLPEHTLAGYAQAIADGADAIEPDLVMSGDGVLIARHENDISGTTDVAQRPDFSSRRTCKQIDGKRVEGWFCEDFSLAELKTLRVRERQPELRGTAFDGQFPIATLAEIIALLTEKGQRGEQQVGLVPEIKFPSYFASIGLPMEAALLAALDEHAYTRTAPVMIQSFEVGNLQALRQQIGRASNIRLLQLLGAPDAQPADAVIAGNGLSYTRMATAEGLQAVAHYADAIGPEKRQIIPWAADGGLGEPTSLVADARAAGLAVVAYTFRPENPFLPRAWRSGPRPARNDAASIEEIQTYLATGIEAFFTDDPALGRIAVDTLPRP